MVVDNPFLVLYPYRCFAFIKYPFSWHTAALLSLIFSVHLINLIRIHNFCASFYHILLPNCQSLLEVYKEYVYFCFNFMFVAFLNYLVQYVWIPCKDKNINSEKEQAGASPAAHSSVRIIFLSEPLIFDILVPLSMKI